MVPSSSIFSSGRSTRPGKPACVARMETRTVSPIESWAGSPITALVNVGVLLTQPMTKLTSGTETQILMKGFEITLVGPTEKLSGAEPLGQERREAQSGARCTALVAHVCLISIMLHPQNLAALKVSRPATYSMRHPRLRLWRGKAIKPHLVCARVCIHEFEGAVRGNDRRKHLPLRHRQAQIGRHPQPVRAARFACEV